MMRLAGLTGPAIAASCVRVAAAAALACAVALPGVAVAKDDGVQIVAPGEVEAPLAESARMMAALTVPLEDMLRGQRTINDRIWALEMRANPEAAAIIRREPGFEALLRRTIGDLVLQELRADHPAYVQDIAIFFDRQFSEEERASIIGFVKDGAGYRYIRLGLASADEQIVGDIISDADGVITMQEMNAISRGYRARALTRLSADDQIALNRFFSSDIGQKFLAAFAELDRIGFNMTQRVNGRIAARTPDVVVAAVADYINRRQ